MSRYLANGALDTSFGINGKVTLGTGSGVDFTASFEDARAEAIVEYDGNILVAGTCLLNNDTLRVFLAQFTQDQYGNWGLDPYFATDGVCILDGSESPGMPLIDGTVDSVCGLSVLQDSTSLFITIAATVDGEYVLARLVVDENSTALDDDFGTDGIVRSGFAGDYATALAFEGSSGDYLIAGVRERVTRSAGKTMDLGRFRQTAGIDFGTAYPGVPVQREYTITNNGESDLIIESFSVSDPSDVFDLVAPTTLEGTVIEPSESLTFILKFESNTAGNFSGLVTLETNDPDTPLFCFPVDAVVANQTTGFPRIENLHIEDENGVVQEDYTTSTPTLVGTVVGELPSDPQVVLGELVGDNWEVRGYWNVSESSRQFSFDLANCGITLDGTIQVGCYVTGSSAAWKLDVGTGATIDDGEPAPEFMVTSGWAIDPDNGFEGQQHRYFFDGSSSDTATWTFTGVDDGHYEVFATWPEETIAPYPSSAAPFVVSYNSTALPPVYVDQTGAPNGTSPEVVSYLECTWRRLGSLDLANGTNEVEVSLSGMSNASVLADAVLLVDTSCRSPWVQIPVVVMEDESAWGPVSLSISTADAEDFLGIHGDPRLFGVVTGDLGGVTHAIDFDLDGDHTEGDFIENAISVDSPGMTFVFDPRDYDPGFESGTIYYRLDDGDWYDISTSPTSPPCYEILDFGRVSDEPDDGGVTLTGRVLADSEPVEGVCVVISYEVDTDEFIVAGQATTDSTGTFRFSPDVLQQGSNTFRANYVAWDAETLNITEGDSEAFQECTFTYIPVVGPTITEIRPTNSSQVDTTTFASTLDISGYLQLPGAQTLDDVSASSDAGWASVNDTDAFVGSYHSSPGTGDGVPTKDFTWEFTGLEEGKRYEILTTWAPNLEEGASNALYTIAFSSQAGMETTVSADQRYLPIDVALGGRMWASLGTLTASESGESLTVSLSRVGDGIVVADAVTLVEVDAQDVDSPFNQLRVDLEWQDATDNWISLASTLVDASGLFTVRHSDIADAADIANGDSVSIRAKSVYWDSLSGADVDGTTTDIDFTYSIPAPTLPSIATLELQDSETVDGTVRTDTPIIVGKVEGEDEDADLEGIEIQFYVNQTTIDSTTEVAGYATTDADGKFTFYPAGLTRDETIQIKAVVAEWSDDLGDTVLGTVMSTQFFLEAVQNSPVHVRELGLLDGTVAGGTTDDPALAGYLVNDGSVAYLTVQFDHDTDGTVDGSTIAGADGGFMYVPIGLALGEHTIRARAREWDCDVQDYVFGPWTSVDFTLAENITRPPAVVNLRLLCDTGTSQTDNDTANATLTGRVLAEDGDVEGVLVTFSYPGPGSAGTVEGHSFTDSEGVFYYHPPGLAHASGVTVSVWASAWDATAGEHGAGAWIDGDATSITFDYDTDTEDPVVVDLELQNDTGDVALSTTDPTITGRMVAAGALEGAVIQFAYGASSVDPVATTTTDEHGYFTFTPSTIDPSGGSSYPGVFYGDVTIRARATIYDPFAAAGSRMLTGDWSDIQFSYESEPANQAPEIVLLELLNDTGESSTDLTTANPTLSGVVTDDGSMGSIVVECVVAGVERNVDATDAAFSIGWTSEGDYRYITDGSSADTATWEFDDVDAGHYEVFVTWQEGTGRSEAAPYSVFDGVDLLTDDPITVNQVETPKDALYDGVYWRSLGRFGIENGQLSLELSGVAGATVVADRVLLVGGSFVSDTVSPESNGQFSYRPPVDPGKVGVWVRAKEYADDSGVLASPWEYIEYTYNPGLAQVNSITLAGDDEGAESDAIAGDGVAGSAEIKGTVSTALNDAIVTIEFDHDGDGVVDGTATVSSEDAFSYTPEGDFPINTPLVIRARTTQEIDGETYEGDWNSVRFILTDSPSDGSSTAIQIATALTARTPSWQDPDAAEQYDVDIEDVVQQFRDEDAQATATYDSALQAAKQAHASQMEVAREAYEEAVSQAQSQYLQTAGASAPSFTWPDAPDDNALEMPKDEDQPTPPEGPKYTGEEYPFAQDVNYQEAVAQAKNVRDAAYKAADAEYKQKCDTANSEYEAARRAENGPQDKYDDAIDAANQKYKNTLKTSPPINIVQEMAKHKTNVEAAIEACWHEAKDDWKFQQALDERFNALEDAAFANYIAERTAILAQWPPVNPLGEWHALVVNYAEEQAQLLYDRISTKAELTCAQTYASADAAFAMEKTIQESYAALQKAITELDKWTKDRAARALHQLNQDTAIAKRELDSATALLAKERDNKIAEAAWARDIKKATAENVFFETGPRLRKERLATWKSKNGTAWSEYCLALADKEWEYIKQVNVERLKRATAEAVADREMAKARNEAVKEYATALTKAECARTIGHSQAVQDRTVADAGALCRKMRADAEDAKGEKCSLAEAKRDLRKKCATAAEEYEQMCAEATRLYHVDLAPALEVSAIGGVNDGSFLAEPSFLAPDVNEGLDEPVVPPPPEDHVYGWRWFYHSYYSELAHYEVISDYFCIGQDDPTGFHAAALEYTLEILVAQASYEKAVVEVSTQGAVDRYENERDFQQDLAQNQYQYSVDVGEFDVKYSTSIVVATATRDNQWATADTKNVETTTKAALDYTETSTKLARDKTAGDATLKAGYMNKVAQAYQEQLEQWDATLNTAWSEYQLDLAEAEVARLKSLGEADIELARNSATAQATWTKAIAKADADFVNAVAKAHGERTKATTLALTGKAGVQSDTSGDAQASGGHAEAVSKTRLQNVEAVVEARRKRDSSFAAAEAEFFITSAEIARDLALKRTTAVYSYWRACASALGISALECIDADCDYRQAITIPDERTAGTDRYEVLSSPLLEQACQARKDAATTTCDAKKSAAEAAMEAAIRVAHDTELNELVDAQLAHRLRRNEIARQYAEDLRDAEVDLVTGLEDDVNTFAEDRKTVADEFAKKVAAAAKEAVNETEKADAEYSVEMCIADNTYSTKTVALACTNREQVSEAWSVYEEVLYTDHYVDMQDVVINDPSELATYHRDVAAADVLWVSGVRAAREAYNARLTAAEKQLVAEQNAATLLWTTPVTELNKTNTALRADAEETLTNAHAAAESTLQKETQAADAELTASLAIARADFSYAVAEATYHYDNAEALARFALAKATLRGYSAATSEAYNAAMEQAKLRRAKETAEAMVEQATELADVRVVRAEMVGDGRITFTTTVNTAELTYANTQKTIAVDEAAEMASYDSDQTSSLASASADYMDDESGGIGYAEIEYEAALNVAWVTRVVTVAGAEADYHKGIAESESDLKEELATAEPSDKNELDAEIAAAKFDWFTDMETHYIDYRTLEANTEAAYSNALTVAWADREKDGKEAEVDYTLSTASDEYTLAYNTTTALHDYLISKTARENARFLALAEADKDHDVATQNAGKAKEVRVAKAIAASVEAEAKDEPYDPSPEMTAAENEAEEAKKDADLKWITASANADKDFAVDHGTKLKAWADAQVDAAETYDRGIADKTRALECDYITAEAGYWVEEVAAENAWYHGMAVADADFWGDEYDVRAASFEEFITDPAESYGEFLVEFAATEAAWWAGMETVYETWQENVNADYTAYNNAVRASYVDTSEAIAEDDWKRTYDLAEARATFEKQVAAEQETFAHEMADATAAYIIATAGAERNGTDASGARSAYAHASAKAYFDLDVGEAQANMTYVTTRYGTYDAVALEFTEDGIDLVWAKAVANEEWMYSTLESLEYRDMVKGGSGYAGLADLKANYVNTRETNYNTAIAGLASRLQSSWAIDAAAAVASATSLAIAQAAEEADIWCDEADADWLAENAEHWAEYDKAVAEAESVAKAQILTATQKLTQAALKGGVGVTLAYLGVCDAPEIPNPPKHNEPLKVGWFGNFVPRLADGFNGHLPNLDKWAKRNTRQEDDFGLTKTLKWDDLPWLERQEPFEEPGWFDKLRDVDPPKDFHEKLAKPPKDRPEADTDSSDYETPNDGTVGIPSDAISTTIYETNAFGEITRYDLDAAGNPIRVTGPDPDGTGPLTGPVTLCEYDDAGNLTRVTGPDPDGDGGVDPPVTVYEYDDAGRCTHVTYPDGTTESWTYDPVFGALISHIGPDGHQTRYELYPETGRLYREIEIVGQDDDLSSETDDLVTIYAYHDDGRLHYLIDAALNVTLWTYTDIAGGGVAVTERYIPHQGSMVTRVLTYDSANRLTERTDRNGRTIEYAYNAYGQCVTETWLATVVQTITYGYDGAGRLVTVNDQDVDFEYQYDSAGRVARVGWDFEGAANTCYLDVTYDALGRRESLTASYVNDTAQTHFTGFTNRYRYDDAGRLERVTQSGGGDFGVAEKRVDFTYDEGRFGTITRYADLDGNDLVATSTYGYDSMGRLESLDHAQNATTLAGYSWTYDGGRIDEFEIIGEGTYDYDYDATGQIDTVTLVGTTPPEYDYDYDDTGNRLDDLGTVILGNRLIFDGQYTYSYDAEGNRTQRFVDNTGGGVIGEYDATDGDLVTYTWDHRNRLVSVVTTDAAGIQTCSVEYGYDYLNRLATRTVDADGDGTTETPETTHYVHDGTEPVPVGVRAEAVGQIVAELDETGLPIKRYLWGAEVDQLLAEETVNLADRSAEGDVAWPLADHQNTIRDWAVYDAVLDETSVEDHVKYDPFGAIDPASTAAAADHLFAYTARPWDPDTGLQNNLNRWYDPAAGRWISEDPIGFEAGDVNLYRYCGNDAVNGVDPSGLEERWGFPDTGRLVVNLDDLPTLRRWGRSGLKNPLIRPLIMRELLGEKPYRGPNRWNWPLVGVTVEPFQYGLGNLIGYALANTIPTIGEVLDWDWSVGGIENLIKSAGPYAGGFTAAMFDLLFGTDFRGLQSPPALDAIGIPILVVRSAAPTPFEMGVRAFDGAVERSVLLHWIEYDKYFWTLKLEQFRINSTIQDMEYELYPHRYPRRQQQDADRAWRKHLPEYIAELQREYESAMFWNGVALRGGGVLRAGFGLVEAGGGLLAATGGGGGTAFSLGTASPVSIPVFFLGVAALCHGAENFSAGVQTAWSGDYTQSGPERTLVALGCTPEGAAQVDGYISMGLSFGSSYAIMRRQLMMQRTIGGLRVTRALTGKEHALLESMIDDAQSPAFRANAIAAGFTDEQIAALPARLRAYGLSGRVCYTWSPISQIGTDGIWISRFGTRGHLWHEMGHLLDDIANPGLFVRESSLLFREIVVAETKASIVQLGGWGKGAFQYARLWLVPRLAAIDAKTFGVRGTAVLAAFWGGYRIYDFFWGDEQ